MTTAELQQLFIKVGEASMNNDIEFLRKTLKELLALDIPMIFGHMGLEWFYSSLTDSQMIALNDTTE